MDNHLRLKGNSLIFTNSAALPASIQCSNISGAHWLAYQSLKPNDRIKRAAMSQDPGYSSLLAALQNHADGPAFISLCHQAIKSCSVSERRWWTGWYLPMGENDVRTKIHAQLQGLGMAFESKLNSDTSGLYVQQDCPSWCSSIKPDLSIRLTPWSTIRDPPAIIVEIKNVSLTKYLIELEGRLKAGPLNIEMNDPKWNGDQSDTPWKILQKVPISVSLIADMVTDNS
jgi:hypothetical protein